MPNKNSTRPSSPVKGKTGNQPAKQRPGGVKEEGKGEPNPTQTVPNTNASAGAE